MPDVRNAQRLLILAAAAYAPLLVLYAFQLWALPHYQFFPLALIGSVLLYRRAAETAAADEGVSGGRFAGVCFVIAVAALAAAILLRSPWLAYFSALWAAAGVCRLRFGARASKQWLPAVAMAATALRLPLNADIWIVRQLQSLTSEASSRLLDTLGVVHVLVGKVIEIPQAKLFVEEACSGVNSLYAAGACTLFFLFWTQRAVGASLLLLSIVPLWVVAANLLRVTAVAYLRREWDVEADSGWPHELLGLVVFGMSMLLIVSTDAVIRFFSGERELGDVAQHTGGGRSSSVAAVPRWFGGALLLLALLQMPSLADEYRTITASWRFPAIPELGAARLPNPAPVGAQTSYEFVRRTAHSQLGENSQIWKYDDGVLRTTVSYDYPYQGWHESPGCMASLGWTITDRVNVQIGERDGKATIPALRVTMREDKAAIHGVMIVSSFDSMGAALTPPSGEIDELQQRLKNRLKRPFVSNDSAAEAKLNRQLIVFVSGYRPVTDDEVRRAEAFFVEASQRIITASE